ncbi:hypothetical protein BP6252_04670 [Coleophoma cylindrospora]|uniref:RNA ligase/cyclic nucleotide phosphodiesterase n=1 Tax=Coleophoma cylindrospora TaxID=1849047 RepID=A0A3D8S144_9HELO|nr:hypothetical protein BP6252_04670 [Coleophoma cylindrospora]
MASVPAGTPDALNKFEDLSGVNSALYQNPYDALLEACHDDPALIQARYDTHRTTRNAQQKAALLSPSFSGLNIDQILLKLEDQTIEPGFSDPRNCLVFWARPPKHIRDLVDRVQTKLRESAPGLWLMPILNLHLTALEVTHSLTRPEILALLEKLGDNVIKNMTDYPFQHRTRLIKPMLSYDASAIALSFVPAAAENLSGGRSPEDDTFSYHHLRRDLFNIATTQSPVTINSRYVVPSSHITIGRFLTQEDHNSPEKMKRWIAAIEEINETLVREFWPDDQAKDISKGEWIVGQEKGLDCREGVLWYGGGQTVRLGKGF